MTLGKDRLLWALFAVSARRHGLDGVGDRLAVRRVRRRRAGRQDALARRGARALAVLRRAWPADHGRRRSHGPAVERDAAGQIALYFAEAGAFVFGSGLAIVPFLHGGVVNQFHWLTERQFLDAVAVAMITPGPVVITVAFIGYLVAGPLGATVGGGRRLPALLSLRRHPGAVLPALRGQPAGAARSSTG